MTAEVVGAAPVPFDVLADAQDTVSAFAAFEERTGHSPATKRSYIGEARQFALWLAQQDMHQPADVFTDPHARNFAVRDYKRWMLTEKDREPKGVDTALTAVDALFRWLNLGPAEVKRASSRQQTAPKALEEDQVRALMRAAERRGPRDRALVAIGVGCGLRVSEIAGLDHDDVWISARQGQVQALGKGDKVRKVPLNAQTREAVSAWLALRPTWAGAQEGKALFLSREGKRLAVRSIRHTIGSVGQEAGIEDLAPHVLRHTFATLLLRKGVDPETVRELMGHSSLETVQIYTKPTANFSALAVEKLNIDY